MSSETAQVSSLPLPPMQYINFYTDDNVRRNRAPLPPRPIHDTYSMFGHVFNADDAIIRSLESQGFRRLYPMHFERRRELKKLNHSLLVNFLDLLDLLVHCPDSPKRAEKVEDLSLLFIHIHHLLNEFRPHQARETLRVMMELQKRQRKHLDKVQDILQNALQSLPDQNEIESNFKVPIEILEQMDTSINDSSNSDPCYELDRIMCNVVDNMR
ncbi:Cofactor required for Sp1 transcriptional activation subunit [Operophtera brumata]|uniref:Mediator of RNA polymerase II transcription subunit 7 n=1 Tax=Operophtera brumata TaxID=104452 RepID=A0A0L7LSX3_OPEBR|nr:Cofactor required for Sp1 transcriptional activation subunit [Operophtera brumata]